MASTDFSGEFMIPGKTPKRIEDDHLSRYEWAQPFVEQRCVADIACGSGYGTALLARTALSVVGVDILPEALEAAREAYGRSGATFVLGDIKTWGEDGAYDLITCFETIEHLAETEEALGNLYRILRPGGRLLISSPNRPVTSPQAASLEDPPRNRFHVKEFTPPELRIALVRSGFTVDPAVYGQRLMVRLPRRLGRRLERQFNLSERLSPKLRRTHIRVPRYFALVARKP